MNDDDFVQVMADAKDLTDDEQQKAGTPVAGSIGDDEKSFAEIVFGLVDSGEIDPHDPLTFVKQDVYEGLDEEWKDKTDLALVNLGNQLQLIYDFMIDPSFTNDSPQLHTMIEQLWQMKQKIEEHHDVFKF